MQNGFSLNESVSAEIRAEMARQSITQVELAGRVGWAQSQLSKRLRGVVSFRADELEDIAHALGISIHQLTSPRTLELPADWQDQLESELADMTDKTRRISQLARRRAAS